MEREARMRLREAIMRSLPPHYALPVQAPASNSGANEAAFDDAVIGALQRFSADAVATEADAIAAIADASQLRTELDAMSTRVAEISAEVRDLQFGIEKERFEMLPEHIRGAIAFLDHIKESLAEPDRWTANVPSWFSDDASAVRVDIDRVLLSFVENDAGGEALQDLIELLAQLEALENEPGARRWEHTPVPPPFRDDDVEIRHEVLDPPLPPMRSILVASDPLPEAAADPRPPEERIREMTDAVAPAFQRAFGARPTDELPGAPEEMDARR